MAISPTLLTHNIQGSGSSIATDSITPSANKLLVVGVAVENDFPAPNPPTAVSGCGITWTQIAARKQVAHNTLAIAFFRGVSTSPSSGALTITLAESEGAAGWGVFQFDGTDISGDNGSNGIVQSASADWFDTTTNPTVNLSPLASSSNATFGMLWVQGTPTITTGSGFTVLVNQVGSNNVNHSEWALNVQNPTWTKTASLTSMIGMAIEIRASISGGSFLFNFL